MYYELRQGAKYQRTNKCPVCSSRAFLEDEPPTLISTLVVCGICGRFRFDNFARSLLEGLRRKNDNRLYKLSYIFRTISERAKSIPDNSIFPDYSVFPDYSSSDIEEMLDRPDPSVQEKLTILLKYLCTLSAFPGDRLEFDVANDYSVLCAKNEAEADFYMKSLHDQGFLAGAPLKTVMGTTFALSARGWIELDKIAKSGSESAKAFVAMWFDPSRKIFFDAMNTAIKDAWYAPIRIDMVEHINRIDDEIIAQIRQSKFLVADLSGQRNGVYFEAGLMLGLGRPVIWACEKGELHNVHFDTRQYNTIDYADAEDLHTRLQFRIEAILGKGPNRKS